MKHPRVGYVMTFPVLSETFILREVLELVRRGVDVRILSIRDPGERVVHPETGTLRDRVVQCGYLGLPALAATLALLLRRPRAWLGALGTVLRLTRGMPRERARSLLLFPKTLHFARVVEREGIEHVHALYAGVHATVAQVVSQLTGRPFSFAVRSSDQLYIWNRQLPDRIEAASFVKSVTELYRQDLLQSRRLWGRDVARYWERFPEDKVVVVRSAVDLDALRPRERDPGGRRVVSVGRLDGHKGFSSLVDAYAILRDRGVECEGWILGGGPLRAPLQSQIDRLCLGDRVRLLGPRPQAEVLDAYRAAAAVAVSSLWEGLPNVLMEALALGVPVVTTDVAGIPELVRDGQEGLLVRPRDPAALADGIQRLLEDTSLRARLAVAGRRAVEAEFGLAGNVDRILAQFHRHTPGYEGEVAR